jgi:metal-responsive CopG/Arc/MetJ family transcriptional regulator
VELRVKTSVTLPVDLLRSLDRAAGPHGNRSRLVEQAIRALLEGRAKAERDTKEIGLINRHADRLSNEAADVLEYQTLGGDS